MTSHDIKHCIDENFSKVLETTHHFRRSGTSDTSGGNLHLKQHNTYRVICSRSTVDSSDDELSESDTCCVNSVTMPGPLVQGEHLLAVLFKQHLKLSDNAHQNFRAIIDSGASTHMLPHRRFLRNLMPLSKVPYHWEM